MIRKSSIAKIPEEPDREEVRKKPQQKVDVLKLKSLVEGENATRRKRARLQSKFTLRIETQVLEKVREQTEKRSGNISANQWIVEAIEEKLSTSK